MKKERNYNFFHIISPYMFNPQKLIKILLAVNVVCAIAAAANVNSDKVDNVKVRQCNDLFMVVKCE